MASTDVKPAAAAPKAEVFQNHDVKDGKVVKNWGDVFMFRSTSTIQTAYDEKKASEGFSLKSLVTVPFNAVVGFAKTVWNLFADAFKSVVNFCCGCFGGEKAEGTQAPEKK